jgi:hypothetical protein
MMFRFLSISLTAALCRNVAVEAFSPLSVVGRHQAQSRPIISHNPYSSTTALDAAGDGKKKRRRKQPPGIASPNADPVKKTLEKIEALEEEDDMEDMTDEQFVEMDKVANFKFKADTVTDVTKGKCNVFFYWNGMDRAIGMLFLF